MFFQPAILALLLASGLGLAALLVASPWVLQLVRHWDLRSGSRLQLVLERRTYLLSTLVGFVLVVQMASLLLFVFNADRMAVQFVGAMCAVGTLQANSYGFPALYAQLAAVLQPGITGSEEARAVALIDAMQALAHATGIARTLREVGIADSDLDRLTDDAMLQTRLLGNNPRVVTRADARAIYAAAL